MSLLPLIRFRNFDAQLTDNEFFNQFTRSVGRDLITTLLFKHFQKNCNQLSTITDIQSNIINKRDGNQQQILSYDCIDKLPSELLSECASYLKYKQYFRFAKCNRNTYIACYAFPSIQKLNLSPIRFRTTNLESVNLNLNAFKNIKTLLMNLKDFNALSTSNKSTWCNNHSLRTLDLDNGDGNEDDIISFINCQHLINYHNVTKLTLSCFQSQLIYNIASKFTQLQDLGLQCIKFDNNSNLNNSIDAYKNEIKKWFMNIKILRLTENNAGFVSNIIEASHNELEFLSLCDDETILTNTTFPKLQTLKLFYPPNVEILSNSQTLKSVTLYSGNEAVTHAFIDNVICKQLALENITISLDDIDSFSILQKIESTLAKNRNIKRNIIGKTFCIELEFDASDPYTDDTNLFGFQIFRVINVLKVSNINDWCLKIKHCCRDLIDKESLENELNEMKRNYFVEYQINQSTLSIIISNSNK